MKMNNTHEFYNGLCRGCNAAVNQEDIDPDDLYEHRWLCGRCREELRQLPLRHKETFDKLKKDMEWIQGSIKSRDIVIAAYEERLIKSGINPQSVRTDRVSLCDRQKQIVDAIVKDLADRRGLRQAWDEIDDEVRDDICKKMGNDYTKSMGVGMNGCDNCWGNEFPGCEKCNPQRKLLSATEKLREGGTGEGEMKTCPHCKSLPYNRSAKICWMCGANMLC